MEASRPMVLGGGRNGACRPWKFLVTTPAPLSAGRPLLGAADYSYAFVLQALVPVLDEIGSWERVAHPESSLLYHASVARRQGQEPVQLAIAPLHALYLNPGLPTIAFPFWEFPRVPDRDFGHDTRQNWARVGRRADVILTACRLTADALTQAGVQRPIQVIPVPLTPQDFELPPWQPRRRVVLNCRHVVWGPAGADETAASDNVSLPEPPLEGLPRLERALRTRYKRYVRPWLSESAVHRVSRWKNRVMRRVSVPPSSLPQRDLLLSGLVYTSIFNLGDPRKNPRDLLSGFLLALRDRPDASLVIKLATNPVTERAELERLRELYEGLGIAHRCRVVVITDYLDDAQLSRLFEATTYYVNTSHAEGACLPLQRSLAGGRPAIAPAHTAMADYFDDAVGFVIRSHPEPVHWPHDPEKRCETTWQRLIWTDVADAYRRSARLAEHDPDGYARLAEAARRRMARIASRSAARRALEQALGRIEPREPAALSWTA